MPIKAIAVIIIEKLAVNIFPLSNIRSLLLFFIKISAKPSIERFNKLLPKIFPQARLTFFTSETDDMVVINSGKEVIAPKRITPIKPPPKPVFFEKTSP
jgi:hypothetical protein